MDKKNLTILSIVFILLVGIYWLTSEGDRDSGQDVEQALFSDLAEKAQINKIKIEKGSEAIELVLNKDTWALPSRNLYPADEGKVTSLLLKILGLNVSQVVTTDQSKFDILGVSDTSIKNDHAKVSLFGADEKEISGLYIGESRKSREDDQIPLRFGQYIRRIGQDSVYLIKDPLNVFVEVSSWIRKSLTNVLPANISSVSQANISNETTTIDFELVGSKLKDPIDPDKEVQESTVSMVVGGLENLNIDDVLKSEDLSVSSLIFDRKTIYRVDNALVYTLLTAVKDAKAYLKISVDFDQARADVIQADFKAKEKARKEEEEKKAKAELSGEKPAEQKDKKEEAPLTKPNVATKEKAVELNEQYKNWVYLIPEFSGKKFRQTMGDLVKVKVIEGGKEEGK